jgi:hypothetical protein
VAEEDWDDWKSSEHYYEHRYTSSGKGRVGPSPQSREWVRQRESQNEYHHFGSLPHQQPRWWPKKYYSEGWLICPPKVQGSITGYFHAEREHVYIFHNREYTYIGQQAVAPKPHWAPYPCPPKPPPQGEGRWEG